MEPEKPERASLWRDYIQIKNPDRCPDRWKKGAENKVQRGGVTCGHIADQSWDIGLPLYTDPTRCHGPMEQVSICYSFKNFSKPNINQEILTFKKTAWGITLQHEGIAFLCLPRGKLTFSVLCVGIYHDIATGSGLRRIAQEHMKYCFIDITLDRNLLYACGMDGQSVIWYRGR